MQMEIPLFIHCSHTMGQVTSPLFNVDDSNPSSCKASINSQRRETSEILKSANGRGGAGAL